MKPNQCDVPRIAQQWSELSAKMELCNPEPYSPTICRPAFDSAASIPTASMSAHLATVPKHVWKDNRAPSGDEMGPRRGHPVAADRPHPRDHLFVWTNFSARCARLAV